MKIYTRTGDSGETGLFDGTRVSKADPRIAAYGEVDELNAWLGLARASGIDGEIAGMLEQIQRDLFAIGSRLADPQHRIAARVAKAQVGGGDVERLEGWIDTLDADLPPLRRFVLAGGSPAGAALHVARTVCRRAERAVVALRRESGEPVEPGEPEEPVEPAEPREPGEPHVIVYLNRLSDLLFVMARAANHRGGVPEIEW